MKKLLLLLLFSFSAYSQTPFVFQAPFSSPPGPLAVDKIDTIARIAVADSITFNTTLAATANHLVVGVSEESYNVPTPDVYVVGVRVNHSSAAGFALSEYKFKYINQGGDSGTYSGVWQLHNPPTGAITVTIIIRGTAPSATIIAGSISFKNATGSLTGGNTNGSTSGSSASVIEGANTHSWSLSDGTKAWSMTSVTMTGITSGNITVGIVTAREDNNITLTDGFTNAWETDDATLLGITSGGCSYH